MSIAQSTPLFKSESCLVDIQADDGSSAYHTIGPSQPKDEDAVHPKVSLVDEGSIPLAAPLPSATMHTKPPDLPSLVANELPLPSPAEDDKGSSSIVGNLTFSTEKPVVAQQLKPFPGLVEPDSYCGALLSLSPTEWEIASSVYMSEGETKNESVEKGEAANTLPFPNECGKGPPSTTIKESSPEECSAVNRSMTNRPFVTYSPFESCVTEAPGAIDAPTTRFTRLFDSGIASTSENVSLSFQRSVFQPD